MFRGVCFAVALLALAAHAEEEEANQEPKLVAMGNLAVIYKLDTGLSTVENPVTAEVSGPLWCQAQLLEKAQPIMNATFNRFHDPRRRHMQPHINHTLNKASLEIEQVVFDNMGKYRCDIYVDEKTRVFGNLMVYSRPFFHSNSSVELSIQDPINKFYLTGSKQYATEGGRFTLWCPAAGFPKPDITWYKNSELLGSSERIHLNGTVLTIDDFTSTDEGTYRCTATNTYPTYLNEGMKTYEASLEMPVKIGSPYGWVLPLLVILVILLLLFIIIYACAACKRYQHDNYNVAKREKRLLRTPTPDSSKDSTKKYELVSNA